MAIDLSGLGATPGRSRVSEQQTTTPRQGPESTSGTSQQSSTSAAQSTGETVKISEAAQAFRNAEAQLPSQPDVNTDRVAQLRAAIEDGSYSVNTERVADRMMQFEDLF